MFRKKEKFQVNDIVIARREHPQAPMEMFEGYILQIEKDIKGEEWAEIRTHEGENKSVRTSQMELVTRGIDLEQESIGVSKPKIKAEVFEAQENEMPRAREESTDGHVDENHEDILAQQPAQEIDEHEDVEEVEKIEIPKEDYRMIVSGYGLAMNYAIKQQEANE